MRKRRAVVSLSQATISFSLALLGPTSHEIQLDLLYSLSSISSSDAQHM